MSEARILLATMTDRADVRRQRQGSTGLSEETVYADLPCAISRTAHTSSPAAAGELAMQAENRFDVSLFLPAGTVLKIGDRVDVRRGRQVFCGESSASVGYPGHSVATLRVLEVRDDDLT